MTPAATFTVTINGQCQCWQCRNLTGGNLSHRAPPTFATDAIVVVWHMPTATTTITPNGGRRWRPRFPPEARAPELPLPAPRSASMRAPWLAGRYIARSSRVRARGRILRARLSRLGAKT